MIQRFWWTLGALVVLLLLLAGWGALTAPPTHAADPSLAPFAPVQPEEAPAGGPTSTLTPCAGGVSFLHRSITASDTPLPNRISQNGVASTCGVNKTFTGSI